MSIAERLQEEIKSRYSYDSSSPKIVRQGYWVYDATHNDLKIPMTLKIIQAPSQELVKYLKRLKQIKLQCVIKIYEIFEGDEAIFLTTQQATFNNLKFALQKCKKLDDADAIFMSKILLTAHVDLLRVGVHWFGTQSDIEFTDGGLKLSWNNSIPFETQNPFPLILSRMAGKLQMTQQKILPFPKNKMLEDLITVSSMSASEIGLNSNMKKKQKISKKRGRGWLCLRESKYDFEYYEENVYLAVHRDNGFVRVKVYNNGKIDQNVIELNKTKNNFTRLLDIYEDHGKRYMISEYSNDGTLFNYVNRLKANSIALKEEQIQFCFYSLFEPLKVIQDSSIKSLCMIHIKNIYIENGIPKIGEPVPMTKDLREQLKDKSEVPDFYHRDFKKNPDQKNNTFDTYSLGVLMYKLMYTEYPIFPQGKVHIPTTPNYNSRLKATLSIFLNQGGLLKDLEKKIEVSAEVAKQVKLNKKKLQQQKKLLGSRKGLQELDEDIEQEQDIKKEDENTEVVEEEGQDDEFGGCCSLCCAQLNQTTKHKSYMLDSLQESPYSSYRLCTKVLCVVILYIFLFYFFFLQNTFKHLSSHTNLARLNVTISTVNYEISTFSSADFFKVFNVTDRSLASLVNTGCFINNYNGNPDYSSKALTTSYQIYVAFGFLIMITIILIKIIQLVKFDFIKTLYNMSNLKSNFNLSNYLIFNLLFCSFVNDHYIFFNQIFNSIAGTCLGVTNTYYFGSTHNFYNDQTMFLVVFGLTLILHFVVLLLMLIMLWKTDKIRYTRIFNPILLILPILVAYSVIVRVGVIKNYFYPSLMADISIYGTFFRNISYINIIGIIPEILFFLEFVLEVIIDWFYWMTFDKRRRMLINDLSTANIIV